MKGGASAALWGLEVGDGTAASPYRETPPRREWRVGDFLIEVERFVCRGVAVASLIGRRWPLSIRYNTAVSVS